ncbi:hypothetical protein BDN71DRAFT_1456516, partial [Pleurotus eryngii]
MYGTSSVPCNNSESEGHRELGQYDDTSQQWTTYWPCSSRSIPKFNPYTLPFGVPETPSVSTAFDASTSSVPCNNSESEGYRELGQYDDTSQQWTTYWPCSSRSIPKFNPYTLPFGVPETPSVSTAFDASTSSVPCNNSESEGHRELGQYDDPSQQWTTDWPYSSPSFNNFNPYPPPPVVPETASVFHAFDASLPSVFSSNPVFQTVHDHSTTPYHASLRSVAQPPVNEWRASSPPLVNSGLPSTTLSLPVRDTCPSQQAPSFVREDNNIPQPEHIPSSDDNRVVRPQIATAATRRAAARRRLHQPKHICKVCGSRFTSKPNRDRHVRAHFGERPFACECGTAFTSKNDLKRHRRSSGHRHPNTLN